MSLQTSTIRSGTHNSIGDLTDDQANDALWILIFIVTPIVSILGIVGNLLSIIILKRHGLRKSSDILLFCLAISDITFLIGINSIPRIIYDLGRVPGFATAHNNAYFMYILYQIADIMVWSGGSVSFNITVLITIERLVAVFLPLKFTILVTLKRTIFAVSCVYVLWFGIFSYIRLWYRFDYNNDNRYNISVGIVGRSALFYSQPHVVDGLQAFIVYCSSTIPLPIVMTGCFAIGVKVKLTSIKRLAMTSSNAEHDKKSGTMSRTTRTLISVCAVFSVTCLITTLPQLMPQFMFYTLFTEPPNNTAKVFYHLMSLVVCINGSCNFLIYVATNKKFRDTQKEILTNCFIRPRS